MAKQLRVPFAIDLTLWVGVGPARLDFDGTFIEGKVRFELSSSSATAIETVRIRALYGHSVAESVPQISMEPFSPPHFLFHGTSRENTKAIFGSNFGIKPMGRQFVHLSEDIETAKSIGRRKAKRDGQPAILRIDAENAAKLGRVRFFRPENDGNSMLWLADSIPLEFVDIIQ
ncbi:hypothetical protein niasHT_017056 [Heterodera trifolii]|uniref:RNA 2'-phosphotransferase n=1 Tax=Heterodera trifolii TaxID=157864 RepID=A0ABD2KYD5_9BILA